MDTPFEATIAAAIKELIGPSKPSIRAVAKKYDLSHQTLARRLKGGISTQIAHHSQQLLTIEQEDLLVRWILTLEADGHAPTHNTIREMVAQIAKESGHTNCIGKKWVIRFLQRHPEIHSKIGRKIEALRIQNTSPAHLDAFFELFRRVQLTNKIPAENIWNMDESGIAIGSCAHQRVAGTSSSTRTYKKTPENREWVTIVESVSAAGAHIRPLVIFKGKSIQTSWFTQREVPNWLYTCSDNGWTSNDTNERWLKEIFLPETAPKVVSAPRILLLDNHGSHITTEFMWICFQNNIHLIYMPPHSSHVLQPLDLSIFSRLKASYRAEIEKLAQFEDSAPIKKIRFVKYYAHARQDALKEIYIKAGWRGAGLVPWNPRKVLESKQILQGPAPPSTPQKRRNSASALLHTPANQRQLIEAQTELLKSDVPRGVRTLFNKTAKAFGQLHFQNAQNVLQINAQNEMLEEMRVKRAKKIAIDSNEVFVNIESIKAAQLEQERQLALAKSRDLAGEARKTANKVMSMSIAEMSFEFSIFEQIS